MSHALVVTGTDTGIGKTVFAAGLAAALGAAYWKPVQAGLAGETDSEAVARLGGPAGVPILPEAYRLRRAASPHRAAQCEGLAIEPERLAVPARPRPLVIEGAGGLMVPLTQGYTFLDLFACWGLPVILCARTRLGTINHTLLSLEALRARAVPVLGIAFIGDAEDGTERIIGELGGVPRLGRLPWIAPLTPATLRGAFSGAFDVAALRAALSSADAGR